MYVRVFNTSACVCFKGEFKHIFIHRNFLIIDKKYKIQSFIRVFFYKEEYPNPWSWISSVVLLDGKLFYEESLSRKNKQIFCCDITS